MSGYSVIGIDVGGTKTAVVEGIRGAEIVQRRSVSTAAERPFDEVFPYLAAMVDDVTEKAARAGREPLALSVSVGGPLVVSEGRLLDPPHLPGWHGVPLKDRLAERFPGLPVFVEHDGNAGALAEFYFGAGKSREGLRDLVFLTFGTGLGAGLIVNGEVVRGATGTAGEVGHWRLADEGPVGFGKAGSWEGFASGAGLVQLAAARYPEYWAPDTPIRELVDDMLDDVPEALLVAEEAGGWMGRGIALLVDALNPRLVVLGALAVVLGERILAPARAVVAREALPGAAAACEIVPAALGRYVGDVAALMAGLQDREIRERVEG